MATINSDAFRGLSKLKTLMMSSNLLTCIPPQLFAHSPLIEHIDLFFNQITALDPSTFMNLPALNYIEMKGNLLTYIPYFNFKNTGMGQEGLSIDVQGSPIIAVHPNFLTETSQVRNTSNIYFGIVFW